jgi:signal transduction histidine kinase
MSAAPRPVVPVWVTDAALAAIIALLGLSGGLSHDSPLSPAATALIVAMGVALLLRRRLPGTVAAFEAAIVGALALMDVPLKATFLAVLVSGYSAAVYGSRLLARALLVAAIVSVVGLGIPEGFGAGKWLGTNLPVPVIVAAAGAVLVGLVVRTKLETRAEHIAALAERAELLAVGQAENERRATLAERLRIAREMHDIVAHHISVVVIQAQGAQRVVDDDPARAGPAMVTVELEFADQIEVIVTDDGQGASAALSAVPGTGRGTVGMRERVAAAGGDLRAGPRPGGGYRVHATIPLGESS